MVRLSTAFAAASRSGLPISSPVQSAKKLRLPPMRVPVYGPAILQLSSFKMADNNGSSTRLAVITPSTVPALASTNAASIGLPASSTSLRLTVKRMTQTAKGTVKPTNIP